MPTGDGTASSRELEMNRRAAATSRKRRQVNIKATDLVVKTLYSALAALSQQVVDAANSDNPATAVATLARSLPSLDQFDDKSHLL